MAKEYQVSIPAHPSIYKPCQRQLSLLFCEPENGTNYDTGILLLVPGFGANAESRVYKKMRSLFADKYNLITVQCKYFGYEFMQDTPSEIKANPDILKKVFNEDEMLTICNGEKVNIGKLFEIGSKYDAKLELPTIMPEKLTYFNDMGIMQALDNVYAVLAVIALLNDNNYRFNLGKIILYGHSHGAYLCYLCNAFAPGMFSLMIDNSAWLFPAYLRSTRYTVRRNENFTCIMYFDYLAKKLAYDEEILHLPNLYRMLNNQCRIEVYHGTTDNLISHMDKRNFCASINNCNYWEISSEQVDGEIFKSTNHGLDADFLKLFDYAINKASSAFRSVMDINLQTVKINTNKHQYIVDYSNGIPVMERIGKN